MKRASILRTNISTLLLLGATAILPSIPIARAGNTWTGGGANTNWSDDDNWGGAQPAYGTLLFDTVGAQGATSVVDQNYNMNMLLWTGSESWIVNESGGFGISLTEAFGLPKIENQSTGSVTINAPIDFAAGSFTPRGEINALNGDLTFGGTLTVSGAGIPGIHLHGGGHTTAFNGTVNAAGKWFETTGTNDVIAINGAFTSGDFFLMHGGTLHLSAAGSLTTSALRLGGNFSGQGLAQGATFALTAAGGGQTFSGLINTLGGNTSGALRIESQNTGGTNTLSGDLSLGADLTIQQAAGGTLVVSGTSLDLNSRALSFACAGTIEVNGSLRNISGSNAVERVVKSGAGTLFLSGNNTYYGATNIDAGIANARSDSALGITSGGTNVANGATLQLQGGIAIGSEQLTLAGTGAPGQTGALVNLGGANSHTGQLTLAAAATISVEAGSLELASSGVTSSGTFDLTLTGAGDGGISGSIFIGAGGVIKNGNGAWTLSQQNDYTGGLTLNAGTLYFNNGGAAGTASSGDITINGGTLDASGPFPITTLAAKAMNWNGDFTFTGTRDFSTNLGAVTITGPRTVNVLGGTLSTGVWTAESSLTKTGAGTLFMANTAGTSSIAGSLDVQLGKIRAAGDLNLNGGLQGAGTIENGGNEPMTLYVTSPGDTVFSGSLSNGGNSTSHLGLVKRGPGALTLTGASSYKGGITLEAGTLNFNHASAAGDTTAGAITITGGSLDNTSATAIVTTAAKAMNWNGDFTFTGTKNLSTNRGAVTIGGATRTVTISGGVLSTGAINSAAGIGLTKLGEGTLSIANTSGSSTIGGPLDLQAGVLQVSVSFVSVAGLTGAGIIENAGVGNGKLVVDSSVDTTFSGAFRDNPSNHAAVGLTKRGTGTLHLTGASNVAKEQFSIENGTVRITGSFTTGYGGNPAAVVGSGTNQNGVLIVDGGTFNADGGSSMAGIGIASVENASGFIRMNSGAINTYAGFGVGMGAPASPGFHPFAAYSMSDGALTVGGVPTLDGGMVVGANKDRAVLNQNGGSIVVQSGGLYIARGAAFSTAIGVVNLGGAFTSTDGAAGGIIVGDRGIGTLNVNPGANVSLAGRGLVLGRGFATNDRQVNLLGGTLTTNQITANIGGQSPARFNFNGGTLRAGASTFADTFMQGIFSTVVHAGGAIIDSNGFDITIAQPLLAPAGSGVNSITLNTGGAGYLDTPVVTINAGSGTGATANAIVSGGAVTGFTITNRGSGYLPGDVLTATLFGGGASTPATVSAIALSPNAGGGLTKQGNGTLTLTGASTYSGETTVSAGTLALGGSGAINGGLLITVSGAGAKLLQLSSTAVSPTVILTQGTLDGIGTVNTVNVGAGTGSIITNGNGTLGAPLTVGVLNFAGTATVNLLSNTTAAPLVTTTLSAAAGTITINAGNTSWNNGSTYDLIRYGGGLILGASGFGAFAPGTITGLGARQTATLGDSGTAITLSITNGMWTGIVSDEWTTDIVPPDIFGNKNWVLESAGTPTDFMTGEVARFTDAASRTDVNISTADVHPVSTIFSNFTRDYTLGSTTGYGIATGSLTKNGAGLLTISSLNSYTGKTTLKGGTLSIPTIGNAGSPSTLGASSSAAENLVFDGGALRFTGAGAASTDRSFTIAPQRTATIDVSSATGVLTISGDGTGYGRLEKIGPGTFTLTGTNTYSDTLVTGGTLRVSAPGTLGSKYNVLVSPGALDLDNNDIWGNHTASRAELFVNDGSVVTNGTRLDRGFNTVECLFLTNPDSELRLTGTARNLSDGDLYKFEAFSIWNAIFVHRSLPFTPYNVSITNPNGLANAGINIGGFTDLGNGVGSSLLVKLDFPGTLFVQAVLKNNYTAAPAYLPLANGLTVGDDAPTGTMILTAANRYTGTTWVRYGVLRVSSPGTLASMTSIVDDTFDLDNTNVWGSHTASNQNLTINAGGLVTNGTEINRGFNEIQTLNLNGGELRVTGTALNFVDGDLYKFEAYGLRDTVTVRGAIASSITNPNGLGNAGINIGGHTPLASGAGSSLTFDVADVSSAADLTISAVLKDNYTAAPTYDRLANGIIKQGAGTLKLGADNSYSGVTTFAGGVVNAATFSNYGSNGSLGNRASDTVLEFGLIFQGGTLQYTGTTVQSTNRAIRVATGTIEASGANADVINNIPSATLSFTAAFSPYFWEDSAADTLTLTLTGTNTGNNLFAAAIPSPTGASALNRVVKNGPGRWVLSGNSYYWGNTLINAGALRITSNNALGAAGINTTNWTIVFPGGALELQGGVTVPEHFHFFGDGPDGKGGLRSISGDNTLTRAFALDSNATIGVDADSLTTQSLIYQEPGPDHWTLTKVGNGTLNLNGFVAVDTLISNAGTTNLNNTLDDANGALAATLNANATTNISVSQTLAALNIGPDAVVTLGPISMSSQLATDQIGEPPFLVQGDSAGAVPEPGSIELLLTGALGLAARRCRSR